VTRHLALVGPTATGKSSLAMAIAAADPAIEIVSLDSMQVYRGMDIGTAKPSPADRAAVPHHLVDVAEPSEIWSVRRTQQLAHAAVTDIETRGRRALLVGGTGLYVRAVVDALAIPDEDLGVRERLRHDTADAAGLAAAYARLQRQDPAAAARIEPGNQRRIVRALEVIEVTGRPFSSFGPGVDTYGPPVLDVAMVAVWLPRAVLAMRIAARVEQMRADGFVDEARALADRPGGVARSAAQAIGYAELFAHLRGEEPSLDRSFARIAQRTSQFARRQRVWFRRDPRVQWIGAAQNPDELLPAVLAFWSARPTDAMAR
jgi:tRNA dimethylallyltransferase